MLFLFYLESHLESQVVMATLPVEFDLQINVFRIVLCWSAVVKVADGVVYIYRLETAFRIVCNSDPQ